MPDFDPLTISDEDLKALAPSDRAKVYKARSAARAAGGAAPAPRVAAATPPGTAPAGTAPAGTAPAGTAPPGTTPAGTVPAGTAPSGTTQSGASPSGTTPSGTTSPGSTPSGTSPSGTTPPGTAPAGTAPAGTAPAAAPKEPDKPQEPPFVQRLLESIPDSSWQWRHGYAEIKVSREHILQAARALKTAGFDYLSFITEVDWQDHLELIYHLFAYDFRAQPLGVILRADVPREGMPQVASVTPVWPGAEFMEREAFEMMGISFLGHPDLRRILLPDDFVGFPMRRDYETDFDYITVKQLVHESD